jgi:hypothetical protein
LGNFLEHLVGAQNPKGLKTLFKTIQPPAKTNPNNQQSNGSQSKNGFVPKIEEKKMKKNEEFGRNGFSGKKGEKPKCAAGGGWVDRREAGGGTGGGGEVMGGGGVWCFFGF